jgi:sugar/nucleoside kinase (ribokinase family)
VGTRDRFALEALRPGLRHLARAICAVFTAVGVRRHIVIGGFALAIGPHYVELVTAELEQLGCFGLSRDELRRLVRLGVRDDDAGMIGAGRAISAAAIGRPRRGPAAGILTAATKDAMHVPHADRNAPPPAGPDHDVLVVGGVGIDTIVRVPALPVPFADSSGVPPIHDYVGHTGNGVALGCRALGLATTFIDFIGDDPQGAQILAHYAERGLDFSHLVTPSGTRRSVNLVDRSGRRMALYDGRHPETLRMPAEFYLPHLRRARHVHLSIMNFARYLYDDIAELGLTVSTDLHDWDGENPYHREFAYRSDVVLLSSAALGGRLRETMGAILEHGKARVVVATAGADGCYLLERDAPEVVHLPAVEPEHPVVDTNGAGDAFAAGFLHGLLAGFSTRRCAVQGLIAGAFACTGAGTHTGFIDAEGLAAETARLAGAIVPTSSG